MNEERKVEFRTWLTARGRQDGENFVENTPPDQANKVARVQRKLGIVFDDLSPNERQRIHASLAPTEANNDPNQVLMEWHARTPNGTITAIRDAIKNYCEFLGDNVAGY